MIFSSICELPGCDAERRPYEAHCSEAHQWEHRGTVEALPRHMGKPLRVCAQEECGADARRGGYYCTDDHRQLNRTRQDRERERARSPEKAASRRPRLYLAKPIKPTGCNGCQHNRIQPLSDTGTECAIEAVTRCKPYSGTPSLWKAAPHG